MELSDFFKSIVDTDPMQVVICDLNHKIIYLNDSADEHYAKHGGRKALLGKSIMDCHNPESCKIIEKVVQWFNTDKSHSKVHTFYNPKLDKDVYMYALRDENGNLIGYYEKHESRVKDESPFYEMN